MTRRELGKLALASAVAVEGRTEQAEQPGYTGALDSFESKVDMAGFDPVLYTKKLHDAAPLRLTFQATGRKPAEMWQKTLRGKVAELLGELPSKRAPLEPQTLEVRDFPGYRREKFVFQSRPGLWVLGYLVTPKAVNAPQPAVVCLPGHGRGVDDIVGVDEHGRDRTTRVGYAYDYAIQVAEHGMAAVAIEPMAFGCRRDPVTEKKGLSTSACQPTAGSALLLGQTMIGWRVYDVMRTIDWIETRQELDAARVGCMGCSGGGTVTLFSAALEPRIKAALVSSYLNTFRDSIMSVSHCIDNYVPGILNYFEMYDLAGLIAPRGLFVESGTRDPIFPIQGSRYAYKKAQEIYATFGSQNRLGQEIFEGEHVFNGKGAFEYLKRWL